MADTLDILRERIRAVGTSGSGAGAGIASATLYEVLSAVQEMFNARYKRVLTSKSITLDANTLLFDIRTKLTSPVGIRIISITVSNVTLTKLDDWRELFAYDQSWLTRTGTAHKVWAPMGVDKFVVYPGKTTNSTATVVYAGETTTLDDAADSFDIPTEDQDTVYDITEAIFHVYRRNFKEAEKKLQEIAENMGIGYPGTEDT